MGLREKIFGDPESVRRLKDADAELHVNQRAEDAAGIDHVSDEYLRLNEKACQAAEGVPWWRR